MKYPTPEEIAHAVQILCGAVSVDPEKEMVTEVSINAHGEITVRRLLIGINLVPIYNPDDKTLHIVETTNRLYPSVNPFPATNPYVSPHTVNLRTGA